MKNTHEYTSGPFPWESPDEDVYNKENMALGSFWKEQIEVLIQQVKDLKAALAKAQEAI